MGGDKGTRCGKCGDSNPRYVCRSCGMNWCHSCHEKYGRLRWGAGKCGQCGADDVHKR